MSSLISHSQVNFIDAGNEDAGHGSAADGDASATHSVGNYAGSLLDA